AGGTTDGDGSHGSTSKTPSYTKSVSWHHYPELNVNLAIAHLPLLCAISFMNLVIPGIILRLAFQNQI
ncbi:hypothetical protein MLE99_22210, partial [Escherichia coli]|nr:hypothetical protein [Escherichia coli]